MPTTAVLAAGTNELHDRVSSNVADKAAIAPGRFIVRRLCFVSKTKITVACCAADHCEW